MSFIACKLPHGLTIEHNDKRLTLVGANVGERLGNVSPNGDPNDNERRIAGFGVTELKGDAEAFYKDWANTVTYADKAGKTKLPHPYPPLENGAIMGPFATIDDLRAEVTPLSSAVQTGFEGLDPAEEAKKPGGVQKDEDGGKGGSEAVN